MANNMKDIQKAMVIKNSQMSQMGGAKVQSGPGKMPAGSAAAGGNGLDVLKKISTDSNANATPKKNALDIDAIADVVGTQLAEMDATIRIIMGKMDEIYQEHQQLMAAVKAAQGGPAAPPAPPQPGAPASGV